MQLRRAVLRWHELLDWGRQLMARIRTIKPELGAHEGLYDLEVETGLPIRFAWAMLFTVADREGRFAWRPRTLKVQILPHDPIDFSRVLDAWCTRAFVVKYRVKNEWFGWIPTFTKHQVINNRESPSDLPSVDEADEIIDNRNKDIDASPTREARDIDASPTREVHALGEGKGKEGRERKGTARRGRVGAEFDPQAIPGLDIGAWNAWLQYRAERKPAIKPCSMEAAAQELAAFGGQQAAVVRHSKANGYQGLVAAKQNGHGAPAHDPELDALAKLKARRAAMPALRDFRDPLPNETAKAYRTAQDAEFQRHQDSQHQPRANGTSAEQRDLATGARGATTGMT